MLFFSGKSFHVKSVLSHFFSETQVVIVSSVNAFLSFNLIKFVMVNKLSQA